MSQPIEDKELIERANKVHFTEAYLIDELIELASDEITVRTLEKIQWRKYKIEEYSIQFIRIIIKADGHALLCIAGSIPVSLQKKSRQVSQA